MEWVWLRPLNSWRNRILVLSCDNVLKFDWYCQFSGSGSNSLNSRKLPGGFCHGLGTRLARTLRYAYDPSPAVPHVVTPIVNIIECIRSAFPGSTGWWYAGDAAVPVGGHSSQSRGAQAPHCRQDAAPETEWDTEGNVTVCQLWVENTWPPTKGLHLTSREEM